MHEYPGSQLSQVRPSREELMIYPSSSLYRLHQLLDTNTLDAERSGGLVCLWLATLTRRLESYAQPALHGYRL